MSVKFDPKKPPVTTNSEPQPKPPQGFWHEVFELYIDGAKQEWMPSREYCQQKWDAGQHGKATQSYDSFMKKCIRDCEAVKTFADWHRKN